MFFKKVRENERLFYSNDHDNYSLAGYNLIYYSWLDRGKPLNLGWSVTADDLLKTYGRINKIDPCDGNIYSLIIDFHPGSKDRIGLIEIERIHIYTYGYNGKAEWSPMMLELRNVYYDEEIEDMTDDYKESVMEKIEIQHNRQQIVEFLYLNGEKYSWNWGRNGMTNAVFLDGEARKYFRQFF